MEKMYFFYNSEYFFSKLAIFLLNMVFYKGVSLEMEQRSISRNTNLLLCLL